MRSLRPATADEHHAALTRALGALKQAWTYVRQADCPRTLQKVQRAIKSAEGAERHMRHRLGRSR